MTKGVIIRELLIAGKTNRQVCEAVGVASATVSYHARKLGMEKASRPTYDWSAIQPDIDAGMAVRDLCAKHGFCKASYSKAVSRGAIEARPLIRDLSLADLGKTLAGSRATPYSRKIMRRHLARDRGWRCDECRLEEWRGRPLTLEVDHIDGDPRNNASGNLRLLCPNCHSVTETWRGRNARK